MYFLFVMVPKTLILMVYVAIGAMLGGDVKAYPLSASCGTDLQQKILYQLFDYYETDVRPPGDGPTEIGVALEILNINSVDLANHEYTLTWYATHKWDDERLQYQHLIGNCTNIPFFQITSEEGVAGVWLPNYALSDEISGEVFDLLGTNRVIRIYPDGGVVYVTHMIATLSCKGEGSEYGDFWCPMTMEAFGDTTYNQLYWLTPDPVIVDRENIILDDLELGDVSTTETVNDGNFSVLSANFDFNIQPQTRLVE